MTKLQKTKCPECNAALNVDPGALSATCDYCGIKLIIENPRQKNPKLQQYKKDHPNLPVIKLQTFAWTWLAFILVPIFLVFGLVFLLIFSVFIGVCTSITPKSSRTPKSPEAKTNITEQTHSFIWMGDQILLHDVNRDKHPDPIGWTRHLNTTGGADWHLTAVNAVNGKVLWNSPPLQQNGTLPHPITALTTKKLLVSDEKGEMAAISLLNGKERWRRAMGQTVERICGAETGYARVLFTDRRTVKISHISGRDVPGSTRNRPGRIQNCSGLQIDLRQTPEGLYSRLAGGPLDTHLFNPQIEGMIVNKVVVDKVIGNHVALGTSSTAAATPMAAAYNPAGISPQNRNAVPKWKKAVATFRKETAEPKAPTHAAIALGRLFIPYKLLKKTKGLRVACFDIATGKRYWDMALPFPNPQMQVRGINASQTRVFVTTGSRLDIIDLQTGRHLRSIGKVIGK